MRIISSILATVIAISLHAQTPDMTRELTKYTSLKNDLYIKKMNEKRNKTADNRNTRDLIREYEALKIYASLRK